MDLDNHLAEMYRSRRNRLSRQIEGIGIRIESGVLFTEDGCEVLPEPPKEIDEIEALCSER